MPPAIRVAPAANGGQAAATAAADPADAESPARPAAPAAVDRVESAPIDGDNGADAGTEEAVPVALPSDAADDRPRRRGWWQRISPSSR